MMSTTFAEDLSQAINDWNRATPAQRIEACRIAAEAAGRTQERLNTMSLYDAQRQAKRHGCTITHRGSIEYWRRIVAEVHAYYARLNEPCRYCIELDRKAESAGV